MISLNIQSADQRLLQVTSQDFDLEPHRFAPDFVIDDLPGVGCQDVFFNKWLEELRIVADLHANHMHTVRHPKPYK